MLLISILAILIYRPQTKDNSDESFSENLATKRILELAIGYIQEETLLYQANLRDAIDFIEDLDIALTDRQKIVLADLKSDENDLRTRYTPGKLQAGIVAALHDYIAGNVRDKNQLDVTLNEESAINLPEKMLIYYYGIVSIVLDSFTNPPSATYCHVNIGQDDKMVWAEIVTDSTLNLEECLNLKSLEQTSEVIAHLYRELLDAQWKWFKKADYLHFYLHVPFDRNSHSKSNLSA